MSEPVGTSVSVEQIENKAALREAKKIAELNVEERRKYNREAKKKSRASEAAKQSIVGRKYYSTTELKKADAFEILEKERKIRNQRVLDVCWQLAQVAARNLNIPLNAHLFTHGVQLTQEAIATKQDQPIPEFQDVWYPGSRIRRHEEFALYDYATSWRTQPDHSRLTFETWLELRRVCMVDVFRFGNEVLGMDLHDTPDGPHGEWSRGLFIVKNPDLLPEQYTWEDMKRAIAGQSEIHQRLLMASRSSYKSSYNLIDLLSWVLVFGGDIRILMVSATQPLSRGFLKKFKSYWVIKNPNTPALFNQLYPEFSLYPGEEGPEKNFISPMRQLDLIQPTLTSSSLTSEGLAGERCDLLVCEDAAEISNSNTPEMREKTQLNFDMLRELLEPFGFLQMVGTPFAPGDIYSVMLERDDKREQKQLLSHITPAWRVKDGIRKEPWDSTLTSDEVELTFPSRLSFPYLKSKLQEDQNVFRQQSLCLWVPDADDLLKVNFSEDVLRQHVRLPGFFDTPKFKLVDTVQATDVATSIARTADFSAICTAKIYLDVERRKHVLVIVDMIMDRFRPSELGAKIVEARQKWQPSRCLIERGGHFEALQAAINQACLERGLPIPYNIYWKPTTGTNVKNKVGRVKSLETLLAADQLYIAHGYWTEQLIQQFVRFDGIKRSGTSPGSKDDGPDAVSMLWEAYGPRDFGEVRPQVQDEVEEELQIRRLLDHQHQMYFGPSSPYQPQPSSPEPEFNAREHYFRGLQR